MINNEKMQQKINTDIQNISLEYDINSKNQNAPKIKYEIGCKKIEKNILNDKNIKVTIKNPKTSEKSLLASQYTIYEVSTEYWLVHRRYSDFDWLRTILCKFYPRIFIPPIPGKKLETGDLKKILLKKE